MRWSDSSISTASLYHNHNRKTEQRISLLGYKQTFYSEPQKEQHNSQAMSESRCNQTRVILRKIKKEWAAQVKWS